MKIVFCDNAWQNKWDDFVVNHSGDFGLLQSWIWGEFQDQLGRRVWRLAATDEGNKIVGVLQLIKMPLPLGRSYAYSPRGPLIVSVANNFDLLSLFLAEVKKIAAKQALIFWRLDPPWPKTVEAQKQFQAAGAKFAGRVQPPRTLILDLSLSGEALSAQLKSKTRYNIRVAQKHCLEVAEGPDYFEDFWRLTQKTVARQEIVPHAKKYYQTMLETLGRSGLIKLIVAKSQGRVIAANITAWFGDWCVYLHGASDYDYREQMAPYLLQWESIISAKDQGKKYYDFWGVDEKLWPGVSRFKTGFAPQVGLTDYLGAYDLPFNKFWYNIYRVTRRARGQKKNNF